MQPDNSLQALLNPGDANNFFDVANLSAVEPKSVSAYNRTNALWLAEFSRLIYRQEQGEKPRPKGFLTRDAILQAKGWREVAFFNLGGTQAGLFLKAAECAALVFRGTLGLKDTITDLEFLPDKWPFGGKVHGGFKEAFDAVWKADLKDSLAQVDVPLFLTGHSLGAALATLAASCCLNDSSLSNLSLAAVYTFGSPRLADSDFGGTLNGIFHCRVVNDADIIPTLPPALPIPGLTFQHVPQLHKIDPNGQLHVFPSNVGPHQPASLLTDLVSVINSLARLRAEPPGSLLEPPLQLRDHTPINYTAQIERAQLTE